MAEKRIKFTVKKNGGGAFSVETQSGFVGAECEQTIETFIGALDAKTEDGGDKDDRYRNKDIEALIDRLG